MLFFQTTRVDDKESGYDKDTTVASDFAGDSSGVTFKHTISLLVFYKKRAFARLTEMGV